MTLNQKCFLFSKGVTSERLLVCRRPQRRLIFSEDEPSKRRVHLANTEGLPDGLVNLFQLPYENVDWRRFRV